jgi:hypothetical protein
VSTSYQWCDLEAFLNLTPRQVYSFLKIINKTKQRDWYDSTMSYAAVMGRKLPSFEEFFGASSSNESEAAEFDEKTKKYFDDLAAKTLKERQEALRGR